MLDRPVVLTLSRQNLPTLDRTKYGAASGVAKGGYVLADAPSGRPEVLLLATGSEVPIALEAYEKLVAEGIQARLVSLPCFELFDAQDQSYRDSVLPPSVTARVGVEAGLRLGWDKYLGLAGRFVGMTSFGASGPAGALYRHFGITAENIVAQAKGALGKTMVS
jgi:transketolase